MKCTACSKAGSHVVCSSVSVATTQDARPAKRRRVEEEKQDPKKAVGSSQSKGKHRQVKKNEKDEWAKTPISREERADDIRAELKKVRRRIEVDHALEEGLVSQLRRLQ